MHRHISRGSYQYLACSVFTSIICISDQKLNDWNSWRQWYNVNSLGAHTYTHTHNACCSCHNHASLSPIVVVNTKAHRLSLSAEPLTNKHLGAIAQIVTDWKELGLQLQITSEHLDHIARTHRTNSERCSKMLQHWLANMEQRSEPRVLLAKTLLNLGYTKLAEFLTTEADPDLFM